MSTAGGSRRPYDAQSLGSEPEPASGGRLSSGRRRGLLRLAALLAGLVVAVALAMAILGGDGEPSDPNAIVYRDADDTEGPLDILSAQMDQQGPQLVLNVRTAGIWTPGQLAEEPGRSVCTTLFEARERAPRSRVCVTRTAEAPGLTVERFDREGRARPAQPLPGTLRRRNLRLLEARFSFRAARLPLGRFRWQVTTGWAGTGGCPPAALPLVACRDQLPDSGSSPGQVAKPLILGCQAPGPPDVKNGPRTRRVVALTFDDGPSVFTGQVLDVLRRYRIRASFFVVGRNIQGKEAVLRRLLDEGNVIGNHTYTHVAIAGGGAGVKRQLTRSTAAIKTATGFTPCVFRPPFGSQDAKSLRLVRSMGMQHVTWDVDPSDFEQPGTEAIVQTVLDDVRPGSIVLMHDGGGNRSQTVAALPRIIEGLRARGYRFVTLHQLLGVRERYA